MTSCIYVVSLLCIVSRKCTNLSSFNQCNVKQSIGFVVSVVSSYKAGLRSILEIQINAQQACKLCRTFYNIFIYIV